MLKKILLFLLVVVVAILVIAVFRPNTYSVQRSIVINSTPDKPYALVNDFHRWAEWSPWQHLDPAMKETFSGAASGQGAVYSWDGNKDAGAGRMEIMNTTAPSLVDIKLEFFRPMHDISDTKFEFTPEGNGTRVTWTMSGPMNYISKVMCMFVSMDKMIGKDFEKGLQSMKADAEK